MSDSVMTDIREDSAATHESLAAILAARAQLACATRGVCAGYLDALGQGKAGDVQACARLLYTDYGEAITAFVTAWQRCGGVDENIYTVEIAAKGFARIPDAEPWVRAMIEELLLDFVRNSLVPATVRLLQQAHE
jgi:hypothetical protein